MVPRTFLVRFLVPLKVGGSLLSWQGRDWTILKIKLLNDVDAVFIIATPHWR